MGLFIWLELWLSIEMDAKGGHIHDSVLRVPEGRCQLVCIFSSVNNFTCKAEISIEPSSPKATSVALDIHLLESKLVVNLSVRGQFQNWGISMAPDNLVKVNPLVNFVSKSKSYDSRLVPCVIVRFSSNQSPFVNFFDLFETISQKLFFHVLYGMEMGDAGSKPGKDSLRVFSSLFQESVCHSLGFRVHL